MDGQLVAYEKALKLEKNMEVVEGDLMMQSDKLQEMEGLIRLVLERMDDIAEQGSKKPEREGKKVKELKKEKEELQQIIKQQMEHVEEIHKENEDLKEAVKASEEKHQSFKRRLGIACREDAGPSPPKQIKGESSSSSVGGKKVSVFMKERCLLCGGSHITDDCRQGFAMNCDQPNHTKVSLKKNGNSNVTHNGQKTIIAEENFVERAAKDFKILSKHARKIVIVNYSGNRCDIVTTFIKIFKAEKCIHVKEIKLWTFGFDEVLTILSWFDAKELKTIKLGLMKSIDRFERITQLEQWKNAEVVTIEGYKIASTMIVHFFHFKCFTINRTDEFPAQAAIQMRDDLLRRSTFQSCDISLDKSETNPIEIAKVFKPHYTGGNVFKIEFSSGDDKFDISLQDVLFCFLLNIKRSLSV